MTKMCVALAVAAAVVGKRVVPSSFAAVPAVAADVGAAAVVVEAVGFEIAGIDFEVAVAVENAAECPGPVANTYRPVAIAVVVATAVVCY